MESAASLGFYIGVINVIYNKWKNFYNTYCKKSLFIYVVSFIAWFHFLDTFSNIFLNSIKVFHITHPIRDIQINIWEYSNSNKLYTRTVFLLSILNEFSFLLLKDGFLPLSFILKSNLLTVIALSLYRNIILATGADIW